MGENLGPFQQIRNACQHRVPGTQFEAPVDFGDNPTCLLAGKADGLQNAASKHAFRPSGKISPDKGNDVLAKLILLMVAYRRPVIPQQPKEVSTVLRFI